MFITPRPTLRVLAIFAVLALFCVPGLHADHDKDDDGGTEGGISEVLSFTVCSDGQAGDFPCRKVDLLSALPASIFGAGSGSDMWGWVEPNTGREIAIFTLQRATAFVDVSDPRDPVYLGRLLTQFASIARDVKVYRNHAFIIGDVPSHGLQIFDLRRLRQIDHSPAQLTADVHFRGFGNSHNLAINEETGFAYAVRTDACFEGLYVIDIRGPKNPQFAGCADSQGPVHDTQCVVYRGGDAEHRGRSICFNSNQDRITILDVTDPANSRILSRTDYAGRGFVHQGWLSDDQGYFVSNDEIDERENGHNTKTYVFDVSDLDAPRHTGTYTGPTRATDHNLYVRGDHVYEANYRAGLRILHIDDLATASLSEVAYFDMVPETDEAGFQGAWTAYPFFPSGNVAVSTLDGGLFMLRARLTPADGSGNDGGGGGGDDCPLEPGNPAFCRVCGPCTEEGQGGCTHDDECAGKLICAPNFGPSFGFGPNVDICVVPRSLPIGYNATQLSSTTNGTADQFVPRAINNGGLVTGEISRSDGRRDAFRFTPGNPTELLFTEPGDSAALAINDSGDVFGITLDFEGDVLRQTGVFIDRVGEGVDRLAQGSRPAIERGFELLDMNEAGDVVGTFLNQNGAHIPYLYTRDDGWRSLVGLDPSFRGRSILPVDINDNGQILFSTDPSSPEPANGFVLQADGELVSLDRRGGRDVLPLALNHRGQVVGTFAAAGGTSQAFLFIPERGRLTNIHRGNPSDSFAAWLTRQNIVGGVMVGRAGGEVLFTWDERRGQKAKVLARSATFANLLPDGAAFDGLDVADMNERLEFVGRVRGIFDGGATTNRFFYFSQTVGPRDLQDLLTASQLNGEVRSVVDINDRGEILLTVDAGGGTDAAILTPRPE